MFVRWKRRKARNRKSRNGEIVNKRGDSLDAVIAENKREGRKIRQRVVCYIGVVHEKTAAETRDRVLFWHDATRKMDALNLEPALREKIEAELSARIAYAGPCERRKYFDDGWKRVNALMNRAAV